MGAHSPRGGSAGTIAAMRTGLPMRPAIALFALFAVFAAGCGEDLLSRERALDGAIVEVTLDSGVPGPPRRQLVWARVPSSGGILGEGTLRVRMPPPLAHGTSSSPEHQVTSVLGGGGGR
jgi:hypothetical protein